MKKSSLSRALISDYLYYMLFMIKSLQHIIDLLASSHIFIVVVMVKVVL